MTHSIILNLTESPNIHILDSVPIFQLPHLQTFAQGTIWTHYTKHQWDENWQWYDWGCCSNSHGFWLPFIGIFFSEVDENSTLAGIQIEKKEGWYWMTAHIYIRRTSKWSAKLCLATSNFVYICAFHLARSNNKSTFNVISYENLENRFLFFFFWKASMFEWFKGGRYGKGKNGFS